MSTLMHFQSVFFISGSLDSDKFLWPYTHTLRLGDMLTSCSLRQSTPEDPVVLDLWS